MNLNDILHKINEIVNKDLDQRGKMKTVVNLIYDDLINNNIDLQIQFLNPEKDISNHIACSIDGSKYEIETDDLTLILARAVKVKGEKGKGKNIPSEIEEDFRIIENYYDKNIISNKSVLFMLSLETKMLEKCEDCDIILIDGPIIDPPVYYDEDVEIEDITTLDKYTIYRASVLKKLKDKNKIIMGIAKNFSHRLLVKKLIDYYKILSSARESYLVGNIFYKYRLEKSEYKKPIFLGWINWDSLIQGEVLDDLKGISKAYKKYKDILKDFSIYSCYYQYDATSSIGRIDFLSKEPPSIELLNYINAWAIPEVKEITLLNKLADDLSEIKYNDAKKYALIFDLLKENYLSESEKLIELVMRRSQMIQ